MTELELCPFCGGEAETLTAESMHGGYLFGIMCNDCRSRGDVYDTEAEAIAAWNSRAAKPCYAADANYERCKYGVNRGWCDDAPFLVWDDTGHLFITMGGLKTWDVTDDARKWSAAHGTLTAEQVREAIKANAYPETSTTFEFGSSSWQSIADELNSRAERRTVDTDDALNFLDEMREADRISYDDYSQLFDAIAASNSRAERTCECVAEYAKSPIDGKTIVLHRCSACHELMRPHMAYCPNCGCKVVDK